jgi:hypothetical protein
MNESLSIHNADVGLNSITVTMLRHRTQAVPLLLSVCVAMTWPPTICYIDGKADSKTGLGTDVALLNSS